MNIDKAPYKRKWVEQQLFTGHLRLDMSNPLTKGNFIALKGDKRASGKLNVAIGAINSFLSESESNKAIFVSLNNKSASQVAS